MGRVSGGRVVPDFRRHPVRDLLKKWLMEDYNAGLQETFKLPNMNVVKRLYLELEANITIAGGGAIPVEGILPILDRIEVETSNEDRFINIPFRHLWFRSAIERRAIPYWNALPAVGGGAGTVSVIVQLDFSAMQDLGLDAGQLDELRMTVIWGAAACLGALVTINSATLTIWYDERVPKDQAYINPFMCTSFFDETLRAMTDGRIELPKGRRITRLYLRLLDGGCPVAITDAFLPRLTVEFDGNVIWGPFSGLEAVRMWHYIHGYETYDWDRYLGGGLQTFILDESYIVIDFVDPVNGQLNHAIDSAASDFFNLVFTFAPGALVNPSLEVYYDYHHTALDRLYASSSKISRMLDITVREELKRIMTVSGHPVAIINKVASVSSDMVRGQAYAASSAPGMARLLAGPDSPTGRSTASGVTAKVAVARIYKP